MRLEVTLANKIFEKFFKKGDRFLQLACITYRDLFKEVKNMKKKVIALLLACMMSMSGIGYSNFEVHAQEEVQNENIDLSYYMGEGALIGYADMQTRGVYLSNGKSIIGKVSNTMIAAGGSTTAAIECKVTITSIVERYVDGKWLRVTSWTKTNENDVIAVLSKTLIVGTGNTYRVRSAHYAASDVSSSWTDALIM